MMLTNDISQTEMIALSTITGASIKAGPQLFGR